MDPMQMCGQPGAGIFLAVEVDPHPCETCAHHAGANPCDAEGLVHREGWVKEHGRLPAEVLGVGTRCPRWKAKLTEEA